MAEEIFSREKHSNRLKELLWTVRRRLSVKMRWMLLAVTLITILIPALTIPKNYFLSQSQQLAQTIDYTYPDISTVPIDVVNKDVKPLTNPGNLGGSFAAIASANQQLQSQMSACIQRKNQVFSQLVAQIHQRDQLQAQL